MKSAILPQILKLEDSFKEYEKIASALSEELKFAVLLKCLSGQLKTYLQVSMKENMSYEELREATLRYDQCTIKWSQSMALGSSVSAANDTSGPMDVDRVEKGGKGKGKHKSKSGDKGKDKGKGKQKSKQGDKGYQSGKGYGNQQQTSWSSKGSSWQTSSWNNNNSDGFGKGGKSQKGYKGKDSGKSRDVTCHKCGKQGHYARDCRVRAVGQSENGANGTDGKADTSGKGNSAGNAQVNRVSFAPEISATVYREFNFDISGNDDFGDFSSFHVNMISKHNKPETKPTVLDTFLHGCDGVEQFVSACAVGSAFGGDVSCGGVHEFSKRCAISACDVEHFSLQQLFKLDDMEHFTQRVWDDFSFGLYDVAEPQPCQKHFMSLGDVNVLKPCEKIQKSCNDLHTCLDVRAVTCCNHVDIILDSGSDVTLIPSGMSGVGIQAKPSPGTYLSDAQGKEITTSDVRDVNFSFETVNGETVTIKDRAFFSDHIDNPLISFGKLLKNGWNIESSDMSGPPLLTHKSGARVELAFRNNSLVLAGAVRMIHDVRVINVDVPKPWFNMPKGWFSFDNFQICSSSATHYIDATQRYLVTEWPYRTTVAMHDTMGWQVIELCEKLFTMDERAAPITGSYSRLLTILSKVVLAVSDFGMVISDAIHTEGDGFGRSSGSGSVSTRANPVSGDGATGATRTSQEAQQREQPDEPMAPAALPQTVAVEPHKTMVKIAGVEVFDNSSISVLKAACSFLQVS